MIRLLFLSLILLLGDLFYVSLFHIPFGKALPMSFITSAFLMFICSLLGNLSLFKYFFLLYALFSLGITAYKIHTKKLTPGDLSKLFLRPSTAVFLAFFVYFFFAVRYQELSQIDDFIRWAPKVRDAMTNNVLYASKEVSYIRADAYPPFAALLEVMFCKFLGGYKEAYSLFALGTFIFSLFVPFFDRFEWNSEGIIRSLLTSLIVLGLLLTVSYDHKLTWMPFVFNSTYVDWTVAALLGYGLYSIFLFKGETSDWYSFALINAAITLSDRISIVFMLMLVTTLFFVLWQRNEHRKYLLPFILFCIVLPMALYGTWRVYVSHYTNYFDTHFISSSTPYELASVPSFKPLALTDLQKSVTISFLKAIFTEPIYYHPFRISFGLFMILITAAYIVLYYFHKDDEQIKVLTVFYIIGAIGHLFTLWVAYTMQFTQYEAEHLAMFQRYGASYSLPGMILLFGMLHHYSKDWKRDLLSFLLVCLFIEPVSLSTLTIHKEGSSYKYGEKILIEQYVKEQYNGEKTLIIDQTDLTYGHLLKYLYGLKGVGNVRNLKLETYDDPEWFIDFVKDYEYILIGDYDTFFEENFWKKITDLDCWNTTLYKVNPEGDSYTLELIYPWDAWAHK